MVALGLVPVEGLVLSSPAFDIGLNLWRRLLLEVLPALAPNLRVRHGFDPRGLSHDPQVVRAYRQDRLVHDRISGRLARFMVEAGSACIEAAPVWQVPTLLLYAGADQVVNPRGSQAFASAAPPRVVETHVFDGYFHEIFNEVGREPVFDRLQQWLDRWF